MHIYQVAVHIGGRQIPISTAIADTDVASLTCYVLGEFHERHSASLSDVDVHAKVAIA
jgi:hypothetical protein